MTNLLSVKLGDIKHTLKVPLELAPQFEEATGLGLMKLTRLMYEREATTTQLVEILRIAFEANGKVYTAEDLFALIREHEGYLSAYLVGVQIIMELHRKPETKPGKKTPPGNGRRATDSH